MWLEVIKISGLSIGILGDNPGNEVIGFIRSESELIAKNPESVIKALNWMISKDASDFCTARWATDFYYIDCLFDKGNGEGTLKTLLSNKYLTHSTREYTQSLLEKEAKKKAKKLHSKNRRKEFQNNRDRLALILIERDGYHCNKCLSSDNLTIDHIIPLSKGASDDPENLQFLCQSCNSKKGDRT